MRTLSQLQAFARRLTSGLPLRLGRRGSGRAAVCAVMPGSPNRLVRVAPALRGGRLRITAALSGGDEQLDLWKRAAGRSTPVLVLPTQMRHVHTLDKPQVPDAELSMAVRWPAAAAMELDPEQLLCNALPMPVTGATARAQTMAICASIGPVKAQLALLESHGLKVRGIDIIDSALMGLLSLQDRPQDPTVVVAPMSGTLGIALMWQGQFCALRTLQLPSGHPRADADYRDALALHIQRTVDLFERQATLLSIRQLVLSLPMLDAGGRQTLAQALPVNAQTFDLQSSFEVNPDAWPALQADEDLQALACVAASRVMGPVEATVADRPATRGQAPAFAASTIISAPPAGSPAEAPETSRDSAPSAAPERERAQSEWTLQP